MRFYGLPSCAPAPDSLTIIPPGLPFVNTFFSIFSTNFSLPFWALCILLSAARRTTRGGFFWAHGVWALIAAAHPHSVGRGLDPAVRFFLCPQRFGLRERSPGGLQAAPTSNGKSGVLSGTPPLPERSCGGVQTPPYKPTEDPTNRKTTIIRQSGETRASFRPIVGAACRPPVGLSLATNGQGLHPCFLIP